MSVRDKSGNGIWISFDTEVVKFSSLLPPLLVPQIPQAMIMVFVLLSKMLPRLREMLHVVWTHHEILHHLVLEEKVILTPGENGIPQNASRDLFAGNAENHPN